MLYGPDGVWFSTSCFTPVTFVSRLFLEAGALSSVGGSVAPGARLAAEIGAASDEVPSSVARKEDITTFATDLNGFVTAGSQ